MVVSGIWKLEAFLAERVEFLKPVEGGFSKGSVSSRGEEVFFFLEKSALLRMWLLVPRFLGYFSFGPVGVGLNVLRTHHMKKHVVSLLKHRWSSSCLKSLRRLSSTQAPQTKYKGANKGVGSWLLLSTQTL